MNIKPTSAIQKLYDKYEYMSKNYAEKIFNYQRYGYEKEDIIQEFRIKIYTSIITYSEKWAEYKNTGKYKPVPIEFYLKTAMVNKVKDFIKLFNMDLVENIDKISIENDGFDYGESNTITSVMSLSDNICEINGVDIFQGLIGRKKTIFSDYLSGFTIRELTQKYPSINIEAVVSNQIEILNQYKDRLLDYSKSTYSLVDQFED
jgi:hypothetical protein